MITGLLGAFGGSKINEYKPNLVGPTTKVLFVNKRYVTVNFNCQITRVIPNVAFRKQFFISMVLIY